VGLFLPTEMHIEESIVIDTPTNVPYCQVANLRNMAQWDSWSKLDTAMTMEYSGPIAGLGAKRTWKSNDQKVGSGSMTIVKDEPFSLIEVVDFNGQGKASSYFKFNSKAQGSTEVLWGFSSDIDIPILGGYLAILMEPAIKKEYKKGLEQLKKVSEAMGNKTDLANSNISIEDVKAQTIICIAHSTTKDDPNLSQKYAKSYSQLMSNIQVNDMEMAGQPLTITTKWEDNTFEYENCIPVQNVKGELAASVFSTKTYSGTAVKIEHIGSYDNLNKTYDDITAYIQQMNFEIIGAPWEIYVSDPSNTVEDKLITDVYFPVKSK
jgi:effector-binding domain-containing protein